jgi:hypothetical protein
MASTDIPETLQPLLVLAGEWAWPTERERQEKRATSSLEELQHFHAALKAHVIAIGNYLDGLASRELSVDQAALFRLALMYMEAALAVEAYKAAETPLGIPRHRFVNPNPFVTSI